MAPVLSVSLRSGSVSSSTSSIMAKAGRPPHTEPTTRKSMTLPDSIWDAINDVRKSTPGRVPAEAEVIRVLLREALDARRAAAPRKREKG